MLCTRCHTPNFRTDRYCRHCGGQLPAAGPAAPADEEVEEQLRKALALLDHGNANDALIAVQSALALEPGSPFAHSVLAHVYERQGRIPQAIQQLEIVLRVHPQSTADREKLGSLTGAIAPASKPSPAAGRRPFLIAATTACAVVLLGGVYAGMLSRQREDEARRQAAAETAPSSLLPGARPAAGSNSASVPGNALVGPRAPAGLNRNGLSAVSSQPQYPAAPQNSNNPTPLHGRIGLPPVYNQPRGATGAAAGLAPAMIGEISPLSQEQAAPNGTTVEGEATAGSTAHAPTETVGSKPEVAPAEPFETDTGFIRVERTKPRVEAPIAAPRKQGLPPSIQVTFGQGGAESLLVEAQREESRAEEAAKTGNLSDAARRYRNAQRLYENLARRGGAEGQAARTGADNCRKALAALGSS